MSYSNPQKSLLMRLLTTKNLSGVDRAIRAIPTLATTWLWWNGSLTGTPLIAAAAVSGSFLMTTVLGSCSIYYTLGWSTCPISDRPRG